MRVGGRRQPEHQRHEPEARQPRPVEGDRHVEQQEVVQPEERRRRERGDHRHREGTPVAVGSTRGEPDRDDGRQRNHRGDRRGSSATQPEQGDGRIADRRLDLLEHVYERRVAAQTDKVDHRPPPEEKNRTGAGTDGCRAPAPRRQEPDAERPEKELENGGECSRHPRHCRVVAVPPDERRTKEQERGERAERERVDRRRRDDREAVAAPVLDPQQAERAEHRCEPGHEHHHPCRSGRQCREGSEEQCRDRRIDELVEVRECGRARDDVR